MASKEKKIKRKVRSAYFVSTVSIALVLFLLGAVGYLILNAREASDVLKENMTVSVWLEDEVSPPEVEEMETRLTARPEVKKARYLSKEKAAEEFKAFVGNDFEEFLESNPLPASFEVTLAADHSHPDSVRKFHSELAGWEGVEEVIYQAGIIEQIAANIGRFNLILLFFGGALLVISLILINNTIRMAIFSKRTVINTMKLVGATRGFILKPFLGKAVLHGIYAGLIACAMVLGVIYGLNSGIPQAAFVSDREMLAILFGGVVLTGILISLLFTYWAVNKYIRLKSSQVYIY